MLNRGIVTLSRKMGTSRQRAWQVMCREKGLCTQCGKKAKMRRCPSCNEIYNAWQRKRRAERRLEKHRC